MQGDNIRIRKAPVFISLWRGTVRILSNIIIQSATEMCPLNLSLAAVLANKLLAYC